MVVREGEGEGEGEGRGGEGRGGKGERIKSACKWGALDHAGLS